MATWNTIMFSILISEKMTLIRLKQFRCMNVAMVGWLMYLLVGKSSAFA